MKLRPTIFLSGVSSEFRSFRDAAEIEVQKKGCFPINQPSFGVDYREIKEILPTKLTEALGPMRVGLEIATKMKDWGIASIDANNLSELRLTPMLSIKRAA